MNASRYVWVIYFVGFDDSDATDENRVEPYVGRERIETGDEVEQIHSSAALAALLRGGNVVAVVADDESHAERTRAAIEMEILRYR